MSNHTDNRIHYPDGEFQQELAQLWADAYNRATRHAVDLSQQTREPFSGLLALLEDAEAPANMTQEFQSGATYRQLAALAHRVDMSKADRQHWYELARNIPLSSAHVGHIIKRLDEDDDQAAAKHFIDRVRSKGHSFTLDRANKQIGVSPGLDSGDAERFGRLIDSVGHLLEREHQQSKIDDLERLYQDS